MNCEKTGELIHALRREKGLTQKQLADAMHLSDRTISKWESGLGCPDVSLLPELSARLGVNLEKMLLGDLNANTTNGGNMKQIKFYVCPNCGNVMTSGPGSDICCCGRKLTPLEPKPADPDHLLQVQTVEDDFYLTFPHEMSKQHYLRFIAYVSFDRMLLVRLYPEQGGEVRFPRMYGGRLFCCCSRDGLWTQPV
ncbi:MAG: helix-turn-helix domain-containing protein [Firmicutes bacterium]|nr:helix-turn-helix domain-containing protein [Bacillota bacterium]